MISIYMSVAVLAATARAKGPIECIFSQSYGPHRCFGAVGQPLIFHLSNKTNTDITLYKDDRHRIVKIDKDRTVTVHEQFVNQSERINEGTFKLGSATKKHSGDYLLEEFGSDGRSLRKVLVHLELQAPVSKPAVSQTCLSPEQMKVSCSCEGDKVQSILTLDGQLLIQIGEHGQSQSNGTAITINLHGQLTGNVTCQVWNNVSKDETVIQLAACKGSVSDPLCVAVIASVVTLSLLLALGLVIQRLHKKTRPATVNEDNFEDEIVYTDVRVVKNTTNRPNSHPNAT